MAAVTICSDLKPKKIKSVTVSIVFPSICHEVTQAGIKIAGRNINNIRYADDTTLMAESKEELKSQKTKIMASGLITSWQTEGGKVETVIDFIFLGTRGPGPRCALRRPPSHSPGRSPPPECDAESTSFRKHPRARTQVRPPATSKPSLERNSRSWTHA